MKPFKPLGFALISEGTRDTLRNHVFKNPKQIEMLRSSISDVEYGLARVHDWMKHAVPTLANLRVRCRVPFEPALYYVPANSTLPRHIDWRVGARSCTIITPIHPLQSYTCTQFWESEDAALPFAEMHEVDLPALMNTQVLHSVVTGPEPRVNFQIAFARPFVEIADLIERGQLFRPGRTI